MMTSSFAVDFIVTLDAINRYRSARWQEPLPAPTMADGGIHNRFRTSPDGVMCRVAVKDGEVSAWSKVVDQFGCHTWERLPKGQPARHGHPDQTGTFVVEHGVAIEIGLAALTDLAMERRKVTIADGEGVVGSVTIIDLGVL